MRRCQTAWLSRLDRSSLSSPEAIAATAARSNALQMVQVSPNDRIARGLKCPLIRAVSFADSPAAFAIASKMRPTSPAACLVAAVNPVIDKGNVVSQARWPNDQGQRICSTAAEFCSEAGRAVALSFLPKLHRGGSIAKQLPSS